MQMTMVMTGLRMTEDVNANVDCMTCNLLLLLAVAIHCAVATIPTSE